MQNTIFGMIMILLSFPGYALAAFGPAGRVETLSASAIDQNTAEFRASVAPNTSKAELFFEYGPTQELGRRTYARSVRVENPEVVSQRAYFLTPNVTYYYRAVIEATSGTTYGELRSFVAGFQEDSLLLGTNANQGTSGSVSGGATGGMGGNVSSSVSPSGQTASVANASGGVTTGTVSAGSGSVGSTGAQNPGGFFQRLFDSFTRARPLQLSVTMNPAKPTAREIVEYTITYTNDGPQPIAAGDLSIILPDSVSYLADNSGGKTTISKVENGQKIALATDPLGAKEKRAITVMAIAGSAVSKVPATAIASVDYTNAQGERQSIATNKATTATPLVAATVASNDVVASPAVDTTSSDGILPNTFFEWLVFLAVVTGLIVIARRVSAIYQERKKRILAEDHKGVAAHA